MRGLNPIPTQLDLLKAYETLQAHPDHISVSDLTLWTQWTRLDPRLGEQWIAHLGKTWRTISPIEFNELLKKTTWPSAAGPLLETVHTFYISNKDTRKLFMNWLNCVMSGIKTAQGEQYFIGLRAFAGKLMQEDVNHSIKLYRRWGYYGQEILINKAGKKLKENPRTLLPLETRLRLLNEYMKVHESIRSKDYIELLGGCISQRQAELDLKAHSKLKPIGLTKGRFYRKKLS